jgi:hypothetical protein
MDGRASGNITFQNTPTSLIPKARAASTVPADCSRNAVRVNKYT